MLINSNENSPLVLSSTRAPTPVDTTLRGAAHHNRYFQHSIGAPERAHTFRGLAVIIFLVVGLMAGSAVALYFAYHNSTTPNHKGK